MVQPTSSSDAFKTDREEFLTLLFRAAAHDLNNILTPIVGYPELLLDQFDPSSDEYEDLQEIQRLGNRAIHLIKHIQIFLRPSLHNTRECDLNRLIRDILHGGVLSPDVQTRIETVNVKLVLDEGVRRVASSNPVLQALVSNLLTAVLISSPDQGQAVVSTEMVGDEVLLRVIHEVSGLKEEEGERILEPFYLRKKFSSSLTGLELAAVQELARQHQGSYEVDCKNGELHHMCRLPVFKES